MTESPDIDPSDGMNDLMEQTLSAWGVHFAAQIREYGTLVPDTLNVDPDHTEVVLALHIKDDTPRSPESGHPYLLSLGDIERLRDLFYAGECRGVIPRQEVVRPIPQEASFPTLSDWEFLLQALIHTVEYVGLNTLKPYVGWSWFDALTKYAPDHVEYLKSVWSGTSDQADVLDLTPAPTRVIGPYVVNGPTVWLFGKMIISCEDEDMAPIIADALNRKAIQDAENG